MLRFWNMHPFSFGVRVDRGESVSPRWAVYHPLDGAKDARDLARMRIKVARETRSFSLMVQAEAEAVELRAKMRRCAMDFRAARLGGVQ